MLILKHLKTLQHVSIIIQIIFRELVGRNPIILRNIRDIPQSLHTTGITL